jgi:hypothetical protein
MRHPRFFVRGSIDKSSRKCKGIFSSKQRTNKGEKG